MSTNHDVSDHDGMKVLTVHQMNKRFDKNGKELPVRDMKGLQIVHASEIADYYGLDLQDVGFGDNRQIGVWTLVHQNMIGQRVPYNSEEIKPLDRIVRVWKEIKDARGLTVDTEEIILVNKDPTKYEVMQETDDGMYARLDDVLRYARANGWSKGGGWPAKNQKQANVDIAAIVAAVLAALGQHPQPLVAPPPAAPEKTKRVLSPEHLAAMAAGRAAKKAAADEA
jgi:hypothetical protein